MYKYSEDLAVHVLQMLSKIPVNKRNESMINQLSRSATSVFANMNEAKSSQSTKDYVHKLSIALKECRESEGWIKLLHRENLINQEQFQDINKDLRKVGGALYSIIHAMKKKL
jgi:four helix bundle protein